jgi:hypothetical protein
MSLETNSLNGNLLHTHRVLQWYSINHSLDPVHNSVTEAQVGRCCSVTIVSDYCSISKTSPDHLNEAAETRAEDPPVVLSRAVRGLARACAAPWHDLPVSLVRCMNIYICIHDAASGARDGYNITTHYTRV